MKGIETDAAAQVMAMIEEISAPGKDAKAAATMLSKAMELLRPKGRAVQVDPIKPTLKAPGNKRWKLNCDLLLSTSAFDFNLRRYISVKLWVTSKCGPDWETRH